MISHFKKNFLLRKFYENYIGISPLVWQGILIGFVESTLMSLCYFLSIYFVNELHFSIAEASFLITAYGVGTIMGGVLGGRLSDLISPRFVSVGSLIIQASACFALTKMKTFLFLISILFVIGVGSYGFITSNHVWTLLRCNQYERLKAINLLDVASNLGLALAGLIVGLVAVQQFPRLFLISSILLMLIAVFLIIVNKNTNNEIIMMPLSENNEHQYQSHHTMVVYFVLASLFGVGLMVSQTNSTYPVFIQSIFPLWGTKSFSILFALNAILVVLLQGPIINQLKSVNKIVLIGIGAFLFGLGMFMLNIAYAFWIAIISCLITTIGEILFFSVAQLICYEKGSVDKKGHSLGSYRAVYATSRVIGPASGGVIYQQFGSQSLWTLCFILGSTCLFSSYYFRRGG